MKFCNKPAYTKRTAEELRNQRMHRKGKRGRCRRGKKKHLRIYQCPQCGFWHLTSKPSFKR